MDTVLMMIGAVFVFFLCVAVLLYLNGALTVTIDGKKRGGKK